MLGRNLDNAFPPFVPGVKVKSVYERAGFDVNKNALQPPKHRSSGTPNTDNLSIRSSRSTRSKLELTTCTQTIEIPPQGLSHGVYSFVSASPTTPLTPMDPNWSTESCHVSGSIPVTPNTLGTSESSFLPPPPNVLPPVPQRGSTRWRNSAASSVYDDSHDPIRESLPLSKLMSKNGAVDASKPWMPQMSPKRQPALSNKPITNGVKDNELQLPLSPSKSQSSFVSGKSGESFKFDDTSLMNGDLSTAENVNVNSAFHSSNVSNQKYLKASGTVHQSYHEPAHQSYHEPAHQNYLEPAHQNYLEPTHQSYHEPAHQNYHETDHQSFHENDNGAFQNQPQNSLQNYPQDYLHDNSPYNTYNPVADHEHAQTQNFKDYPQNAQHSGLGLDLGSQNNSFNDLTDVHSGSEHPYYDSPRQNANELEEDPSSSAPSHHNSTSTVATSLSEYHNQQFSYDEDHQSTDSSSHRNTRISSLSAASLNSPTLPLSVNKHAHTSQDLSIPRETDEIHSAQLTLNDIQNTALTPALTPSSYGFNNDDQQRQSTYPAAPPLPVPRAGPKSRKHCRGCKQKIVGRCVSAKDGQISGKWHRECFACIRCQDQLGSEFYVLNDSPYCYQCYHEENCSICPTCELGIEGECLESGGVDRDTELIRYHPQCLSCMDCGSLINQDEFYTMNKLPYCSFHKDQFKSNGTMEKRKSRFMFM